jgi:hypothetical protein
MHAHSAAGSTGTRIDSHLPTNSVANSGASSGIELAARTGATRACAQCNATASANH